MEELDVKEELDRNAAISLKDPKGTESEHDNKNAKFRGNMNDLFENGRLPEKAAR